MKCQKCGSEHANNYCPNCGTKSAPLAVSKWAKMRFAFGITNLVVGLYFLFTILSSEGGIDNNTRMMVSAWFFSMTGLIALIGKQSKGLTITSIVFYSLGILYNLIMTFELASHVYLVIIMTVFLTLTCVSLKDSKSFKK